MQNASVPGDELVISNTSTTTAKFLRSSKDSLFPKETCVCIQCEQHTDDTSLWLAAAHVYHPIFITHLLYNIIYVIDNLLIKQWYKMECLCSVTLFQGVSLFLLPPMASTGHNLFSINRKIRAFSPYSVMCTSHDASQCICVGSHYCW